MEKRIVCNGCGKEIKIVNGIAGQDYLSIKKEWGYFSGKDGKLQELILCEACWDELLSRLKIPALTTEVTELM